ncbi:TRAP-type C4-dicarboxylate transport system periplasmic component [Vibrio variabilis]|uniref:TRAP-type C4-dicarboxylate transport system periplasmic component n=1 Tax=Vibrio variabilis TaxID=990271 RepID=A0ABQ0JRU0_9VIBR|nr:TRAP-type C4-dicarboxylate transport system periplasmic component [Vibrio variabilis]
MTTNLNLGSANCPVVVNTEALEMLKPEHREALLSSVPEALDYYVSNYEQNTTAKFDKAIADEGVTQVTFTADQTAELNDLAASVREDWVNKYKGQFDSQALFDYTEALFKQQN